MIGGALSKNVQRTIFTHTSPFASFYFDSRDAS